MRKMIFLTLAVLLLGGAIGGAGPYCHGGLCVALLGTGTQTVTPVGVICAVSTAVGNLGASGPDDLQTCTIAANSLVATNRGIRVTARGTCANNVNAKTFTLNVGTQVVLTHACTASVAGETWVIQAEVLRTGASAQDWYSHYLGSTGVAGALEFDPELGTATQTETATIAVKMQSTASTANNDIVEEELLVEAL